MNKFATALSVIAIATAAATPVSAQSILDRITKALEPKSAPQQTDRRNAGQGAVVASLTAQQAGQIDTLLVERIEDQAIASDRSDAMPLIKQLVTIGACAQSGEAWNSVNRFYLTPMTHYAWLKTPMFHMKYHDKSACLDTTRLSEWSKPANNAVKFRASYVAADSGEANLIWFELQKASDGSWMIRRINEMK